MTGNDAPGDSFTRDLERGRDENAPRPSNVSAGEGIGSALSSTNSSIMGDDVQADLGEEWGPRHPCYPHMNPHVPIDSTEYATTRIIRVRRDWLLHGDLAPAFSNLYPEILDPAGISEQEFRKVIGRLNAELGATFNPYAGRNIVDSVMGALTGWLWDDLGMTASKRRLAALEKWIEQWNSEMQKSVSTDDSGLAAPRIISLRKTGYMTLDIQIPDPEIAPAPSTAGGNDSRTVLPTEPVSAMPV
ncbi:Ras modification protein ERF4 [Beauveria bassiana]|uniref:Ras modification protein ERF4 n=1 Tax=Beauveria bassiana (strain ARSEF 2860) TaxID=655819 RepID=J5JXG8_BEAB2|nr:Golgin subfamily A member [Beauveria bassiana ARSEF 2860]EJP66971.1 Golgin subfamily A member [Beauveria bassiana ARSEF 2860]KAF1732012.1 Ras modification protein ERF4 [Beauveria bassiana]KAH8716269.1 Ras modification protein ERF4 [Beauveria bassiana]